MPTPCSGRPTRWWGTAGGGKSAQRHSVFGRSAHHVVGRFFRRQGVAEQIALHFVAAHSCERVTLELGFNPLAYQMYAKALGNGDDRVNDRAVRPSGLEIADKALVDLEGMK